MANEFDKKIIDNLTNLSRDDLSVVNQRPVNQSAWDTITEIQKNKKERDGRPQDSNSLKKALSLSQEELHERIHDATWGSVKREMAKAIKTQSGYTTTNENNIGLTQEFKTKEPIATPNVNEERSSSSPLRKIRKIAKVIIPSNKQIMSLPRKVILGLVSATAIGIISKCSPVIWSFLCHLMK